MKLGLRAIPALASKMEEWSSPFRSEETMSSSVKARMPNFFFLELAETLVINWSVFLTLELAVGGVLDGLLDLVVRGTLLDTAGEVNDGDVRGRHTHGHTGELAVEGGDDLADGLGGAGGGGNDVLGCSTATTPVLGGGSIDNLLGSGVGVNGGHETLNDTELVVDDLGEGSQAVGGARGVGEDVDVLLVLGVVDTHDEHGGVSGGSGDDDLLGTTLQVGRGLLGGGEDTSGLDDVGGTGLSPGDGGGVLLSEEADLLAVDDEALGIDLDGTLELTVGAVILEHVGLPGEVNTLLLFCAPFGYRHTA